MDNTRVLDNESLSVILWLMKYNRNLNGVAKTLAKIEQMG